MENFVGRDCTQVSSQNYGSAFRYTPEHPDVPLRFDLENFIILSKNRRDLPALINRALAGADEARAFQLDRHIDELSSQLKDEEFELAMKMFRPCMKLVKAMAVSSDDVVPLIFEELYSQLSVALNRPLVRSLDCHITAKPVRTLMVVEYVVEEKKTKANSRKYIPRPHPQTFERGLGKPKVAVQAGSLKSPFEEEAFLDSAGIKKMIQGVKQLKLRSKEVKFDFRRKDRTVPVKKRASTAKVEWPTVERVLTRKAVKALVKSQERVTTAKAVERSVSGVPTCLPQVLRRKQRDAIRSSAAKSSVKKAYKQLPKEQREKQVKAMRDKRNGVELQSGGFLDAAVKVALGGALVALGSTLNKCGKTADAVTEMVDNLKKLSGSLKQYLGKALWAVPLLMTVYFAVNHFSVASDIVRSVITAALSAVVGKKLWSVASEFFRFKDDDSTIELQSGSTGTIAKMLSTLMAFSIFGTASRNKVSEFMKRMSVMQRVSDGWETFLGWMLSAIESVVNFCRARFGKDSIMLFKNGKEPTYLWAQAVNKLHANQSTEAEVSAEVVNQLVSLIKEGTALREIYKQDVQMRRFVDDHYSRLVNMITPYQGSIAAANNMRFEPVCAVFLGAPGIGKTVMSTYLCSTILMESGLMEEGSKPSDIAKEIFQKGTSEYWNSYVGQKAVVMDDVFQTKVIAGDKDNDFINLIRMVSSWSFPLNFADLASKGKIFFGSKFIFGTTNTDCLTSEAGLVVTKAEAVGRRIKFPYHILLKPEYKNEQGHLDMRKFLAEQRRCLDENVGIDRFPWHFWVAKKHDFLNGQSQPNAIELRDVIVEIIDEIKVRTQAHKLSTEIQADYVSGLGKIELQSGSSLETEEPVDSGKKWTRKHFVEAFDASVKAMSHDNVLVAKFLKGSVFAVGTVISLLIAKAVLGGIWKFLKSIFGRKSGKPNPQSNKAVLKQQYLRASDPRLEAGDGLDGVYNQVYDNTYKMFVDSEAGPRVVGQICFIESTLACQPEHFTAQVQSWVEEGVVTNASRVHLRHVQNADLDVFLTIGKYLSLARHTDRDNDVEFIDFEQVRAHKNIVNKFLTEGDLATLRGKPARLDICDVDSQGRLVKYNVRRVNNVERMSFGKNLLFSGRKLNRFVSYSTRTDRGDCGAPLTLYDNRNYEGRTLVGFHVAGDTQWFTGYSNIVTREMVHKARDVLGTIKDNFDSDLAKQGVVLESGTALPANVCGTFLPIGKVDKPMRINCVTSFYKTKLFGTIGLCDLKPAIFRPVYREGVLVNPMQRALQPYASQVRLDWKPWFPQAMHVATIKLFEHTRGFSRDIYTFEQAVKGIPAEDYRALPRGTSAGYPLCTELKSGKKEIFGFDTQEYDLTSEAAISVMNDVELMLDDAKKGIRQAVISADFMKDELRPARKIDAVATRLISGTPLKYCIAVRRYFGAFTSAMFKARIKCGMAPGIRVYQEWDILGSHLQSKGPDVFAGDFKGFDASQQASILALVLDVINRWYDDGAENALVRRVLWEDLVHSRHIGGDGLDQSILYQWNKSLPSGHPLTTVVNSIYSLFLLVCAYMRNTGDLNGFWEHVAPITYGDDNVCNVDNAVKEKFNQVTVASALKEMFDIIYTSDKKDAELVPLSVLSDVTFLKRSFVVEGRFWRCPLELDSFLYTHHWCKNRKLESEILRDVLEIALHELSHHTQERWSLYAPQIIELLRTMGHEPRSLPTRDQYYFNTKKIDNFWC